ncbi:MAG: hypothetical protein AAF690_10045 [Acidobacteriota bacterium]
MPKSLRCLTWLDLLVCATLATPLTAPAFLDLMHRLSSSLGWAAVFAPSASGTFFVNLAGVLGTLWNVAMLREVDMRLHAADLAGRLAVASLIVFHTLRSELPPVFGLFVLTEAAGGLLKARWIGKSSSWRS